MKYFVFSFAVLLSATVGAKDVFISKYGADIAPCTKSLPCETFDFAANQAIDGDKAYLELIIKEGVDGLVVAEAD